MTLSDRLRFQFPRWGQAAEHLLALVGVVVLLIGVGKWVYNFASLSNTTALALPVCEFYPFRDSAGVPPGTRGDVRLIGARILPLASAANLRVRLRGLTQVFRWGLASDALSQQEVATYLNKLSTGPADVEVITPPLPPLPPESKTEILVLATVENDSTCARADYAEVFGGDQKILAFDPNEHIVPGLSLFLSIWVWLTIFLMIIAGILLGYVIVRRRRRMSKHQPQLPP